MSEIEKKIKKIKKIPGVINWARQNYKRTDDTQKKLQNLVSNPIGISLQPIYGLCKKLAYRDMAFEEAYEKVSGYRGSLGSSGTSILRAFHDYIEQSQIEAVKEFDGFSMPYPIARDVDGEPLAIPVKPHFVTIREGKLRPTFIIGWADRPLNAYQIRLLSTIISNSLLTQQDFIGSDADIVAFPKMKWSSARECNQWPVSRFANLSNEELADQFERYSRALRNVIATLRESEIP